MPEQQNNTTTTKASIFSVTQIDSGEHSGIFQETFLLGSATSDGVGHERAGSKSQLI